MRGWLKLRKEQGVEAGARAYKAKCRSSGQESYILRGPGQWPSQSCQEEESRESHASLHSGMSTQDMLWSSQRSSGLGVSTGCLDLFYS